MGFIKKSTFFLICLFFLIIITNYSNIAMSATVLSTQPVDGATYVPTYVPVSVEVSDIVDLSTLNFDFNPAITGVVDYDECDILSYYYSGTVPVYRNLDHCYRLVFTPSIDLTPGTTYTASVSGGGLTSPYSWSFTAGDFLSVTGELQLATYASPLRHKSAVAMNSSGNYVVVWQDSDGISAQVFAPSGYPRGSEIHVGTYYSDYHGPSVAINDNGDFVVAWKDDFFDISQGKRELWYFTKKIDSYGQMGGGWNDGAFFIKHTLPDAIYADTNAYKSTIHPVGKPSVGIDESGRYVVVYSAPICYQAFCQEDYDCPWYDPFCWISNPPQCKIPDHKCDNYIWGFQVSADGSSYTRLGEQSFTQTGGNSWSASYDTPMISQPPHPSYSWTQSGCGGINGAYYPEISMAPNGKFVVTWLEWQCNEWDNVKARIYNSNCQAKVEMSYSYQS